MLLTIRCIALRPAVGSRVQGRNVGELNSLIAQGLFGPLKIRG